MCSDHATTTERHGSAPQSGARQSSTPVGGNQTRLIITSYSAHPEWGSVQVARTVVCSKCSCHDAHPLINYSSLENGVWLRDANKPRGKWGRDKSERSLRFLDNVI